MNEFMALTAEALEKDEVISPDDAFRNYEEWDSLAVLSLIAMIKQNYDITIPRKDFETLITVKELYDYVKAHQS